MMSIDGENNKKTYAQNSHVQLIGNVIVMPMYFSPLDASMFAVICVCAIVIDVIFNSG